MPWLLVSFVDSAAPIRSPRMEVTRMPEPNGAVPPSTSWVLTPWCLVQRADSAGGWTLDGTARVRL